MLPLGWVIPDGTNRTLEEIKDRKISNDHSPGGGQAGAVVITLQRLEPYLGTQFFLVDLETGEMFAYIRQQWRRTGLNCSDKPFVIKDLIQKVERQGQAVWAEIEAEDQTPLVNIRRSPGRFEVPPPLPVMDEPAVYVLHPDVMQINTRKNYVRDRMRAALIYISEYAETKRMMTEGRYNNDDLLVRLRAVFGRVDQVKHHIDVALQQDDAHVTKATRFSKRIQSGVFLKQPKAVSLVETKKKRKSLKTETILSAEEEDEEDEIPEGFHLQEESPHCLNMQQAEDFQAYLRQLVLEFERMLKAGATDMKIEYGKVIESFYWACKANKQTICNDAKPEEVLASIKDASCKAWKLKLSGKESADPTTLVAEQPVAPQRASDAVSFKNPDEILESLKEELAGKTPLQIKELKITIANICRSQALAH